MFAGWQNYAHVAAESTWGVTGSPTYRFMPYLSCDIKATPKVSKPQLYLGNRQSISSRNTRYDVAGNFNTFLFGKIAGGKSHAQFFIEKALSAPQALFCDPFLIETFENDVDNKRWNGCRINTMQIQGQADGDGVTLNMGIVGKSETGGITEQNVSNSDYGYLDPFVFADATLVLNSNESSSSSADTISIREFTLDVNNNLQPYGGNSSTIIALSNGVRECKFSFSLFKETDIYDRLRRTTDPEDFNAVLTLKGVHGGTGSGTYSTVTFTMPKMRLADSSDQKGINDLATVQASWDLLKPATSQSELEVAFGTA